MGKTAVDTSNWLKSKDVKKELKISDCDLAHIRIAGELEFIKHGNAFLYDKVKIEKIKLEGSIKTILKH
jgi:hypothetical protein